MGTKLSSAAKGGLRRAQTMSSLSGMMSKKTHPLVDFEKESLEGNRDFDANMDEKLESKCKFIDFGYSKWGFEIIFTGVKDLKYVKDFINKLREGNKLTFGKETIEIEEFEAILYKSKEDAVNDKYTKI